MRAALAIALFAGACVAADEPAVMPLPVDRPVAELTSYAVSAPGDEVDVCGLAASLPDGDVCALVCDPDAFAARLVDDGMRGGRCYQLRCTLADDVTVSVGVCLP